MKPVETPLGKAAAPFADRILIGAQGLRGLASHLERWRDPTFAELDCC